MGKNKLLRMDLLNNVEDHVYGSVVMTGDPDISTRMCQYDQAQIAGTVYNMQKPWIIKIASLIGRVQLDSDKSLLLSEAEFICISIKIRMYAGKRQYAQILMKGPVSVQTFVYLMNLERGGHDREIDAETYACLSHGSGQAGGCTVSMRRNASRSGENFQRAVRNAVRENMCVKIDNHGASITHYYSELKT